MSKANEVIELVEKGQDLEARKKKITKNIDSLETRSDQIDDEIEDLEKENESGNLTDDQIEDNEGAITDLEKEGQKIDKELDKLKRKLKSIDSGLSVKGKKKK